MYPNPTALPIVTPKIPSGAQKYYFRQIINKFLIKYSRKGDLVTLIRLKKVLISMLYTLMSNQNKYFDERALINTFLEKLFNDDEKFVLDSVSPNMRKYLVEIVEEVLSSRSDIKTGVKKKTQSVLKNVEQEPAQSRAGNLKYN